jgi:hypothetical protein
VRVASKVGGKAALVAWQLCPGIVRLQLLAGEVVVVLSIVGNAVAQHATTNHCMEIQVYA